MRTWNSNESYTHYPHRTIQLQALREVPQLKNQASQLISSSESPQFLWFSPSEAVESSLDSKSDEKERGESTLFEKGQHVSLKTAIWNTHTERERAYFDSTGRIGTRTREWGIGNLKEGGCLVGVSVNGVCCRINDKDQVAYIFIKQQFFSLHLGGGLTKCPVAEAAVRKRQVY